jgi:hypothetical protein
MKPCLKYSLVTAFLGCLVTACSGASSFNPTSQSTPIPPTLTAPANTPSPTPKTPDYTVDNWKDWPILPVVSTNAKAIYERGLQLGSDPNRFVVFGDCQSMPNFFLARYDQDAELVAALPVHLQETIRHFSGSFEQSNPTLWPGTNFAAVLWDGWVQPIFNFCQENETPLNCVLRVRNPSIVLINLGTHYEVRNYEYVETVLRQLIDHGVLPVLTFKADNREGDERINREIAQAAIQFDIPVWNFYRAASSLANNGLKQAPDDHNIYLTDEGLELHRHSALQALDAVWRQLNDLKNR